MTVSRSPFHSPTGARLYDALLRPFESRVFARWRRRTWAAVPTDGVGLEIGAGTGANFRYHPPGGRVVASDLSPPMLRRAAARRDAARPPLAAADAMRLPFRDAAFDWVCETLVFCEVPDPVTGLLEVRRVLRPGGALVMLEHVRPGGVLGHAADALTRLSAPLMGEHFDRDAEAAVREAGFHLRRREWLWRDAVVLLVADRDAS
jgi:phosphatidylethanolamine/phosphatidyl-N-methylethanolamine N-methyltransferase